MEYEFQLCKEALRPTREEGQFIEAAVWAACRDPHHRIEHWLTLLSIANSGGSTITTKASSSSSSSIPANQRLQRIEKKFAEFEKALQRSRSPRMRPGAPQGQLALPAAPNRGGNKANENSKGKGKGNKKTPQAPSGFKTFDQIYANVSVNRPFFHKTQNKKGVCFQIPKGSMCREPVSAGPLLCCVW